MKAQRVATALPPMSDMEIRDFLGRPQIGMLGINRKKRAPQLVPVYYRYDGQYIWIPSEKRVAKVRNVRNDPRVTFCVDERTPPHKGVVIYGKASIIEKDIDAMRKSILARYTGEEKLDQYADEPRPLGKVLIRVSIERIYSYDYAKSDYGWSHLGQE